MKTLIALFATLLFTVACDNKPMTKRAAYVFPTPEWQASSATAPPAQTPTVAGVSERPAVPSVTAKEIEIFGSDLEGKTVEMIGKFYAVTTIFLPIAEDARLVGFLVLDKKGDQVIVFANKARYGRVLVGMNTGDQIHLIGKVRGSGYSTPGVKLPDTYVLLADTLSP